MTTEQMGEAPVRAASALMWPAGDLTFKVASELLRLRTVLSLQRVRRAIIRASVAEGQW
jgi:hypothetical protein